MPRWTGSHTHWLYPESGVAVCGIYLTAGQRSEVGIQHNPEAVSCGNCARTAVYRFALANA